MRPAGRAHRLSLHQTGFVVAAVIGCMAITSAYLAIGGHATVSTYRYTGQVFTHGNRKRPLLFVYTIHHLAFTYPPGALLYLTPLNVGSFLLMRALLWVVSITAVAVAIYIVVLRSTVPGRHAKLLAASLGWACLSVLLGQPVRSTIDYGQVDAVLMLLVVTDLLVIPEHRGWVLGIACAIKLTPLVFLILLAVERDWKSVARCIGVFLGSSALMLVVWPSTSKQYWLHAAWETGRIGSVAFGGNQSWNGLIYRLSLSSDGRAIAWICACLVTVALGVAVASRCVRGGQRVGAMFATAMCGLLISPISWTHHWIWVVLIPPIVLSLAGREMPRSVRRHAVGAAGYHGCGTELVDHVGGRGRPGGGTAAGMGCSHPPRMGCRRQGPTDTAGLDADGQSSPEIRPAVDLTSLPDPPLASAVACRRSLR